MSETDKKSLDQDWWSAAAEKKLLFQRCTRCDSSIFYPRAACPQCLSPDLEWRESKGEGAVYSCTVVHRAPNPSLAADVPYTVVLAELDEGFRMMARLLDSSTMVSIGARVRVVFVSESDRALPCFELV